MKWIYSTMFPTERMYTENTEPFLVVSSCGLHFMSDEAYIDHAIRFANEQRIRLDVFQEDENIRLDFSFHALYVETGETSVFSQILSESDKYCIRVEKDCPSKLFVSFKRKRCK